MLGYSYIDSNDNVPAPKNRVNGGLYTGEAAKGPWGSVPVIADPTELSRNLMSANPPRDAEKLPMTLLRPGNNHYEYPYHQMHNPKINQLRCLPK